MTLLSAVLALAAPSDERCVSLSTVAARWPVTVTAALEREVALMPDTVTDEVAKALALSLHADLTKVGDRWRLFRSDETNEKLRQSDRDWLKLQADTAVSRVGALSKRYSESVAAPFTAMRAAQARFEARRSDDVLDMGGMHAQEVTPAARLAADLLSRLSLDVPPGTFAIFSNSPIGVERPLTVGQEALKSYLVSQERLSQWADSAFARGDVPNQYRWVFPSGGFRPGPRTIQVCVDRSGAEPSFALDAYDSAGRRESHALLTARGFETLATRPPKASVLGKAPLPANVVARLESAKPGAAGFRPDSLDPVSYEPLDVVVRAALRLWATAKGFAHIVACVPDALLDETGAYTDGTMVDLDALSAVIEKIGCESLNTGSTLVLRPKLPIQEEALRLDRRPLSALFLRAKKGSVGLDALCDYHAAYSDAYERNRTLTRLERPLRAFFRLDTPNWNLPHPLLAILGKLAPTQRGSLVAGGRVKLDDDAYSSSLLSLAQLASSRETTTSDLGRLPARILASPGGAWLQGASDPPSTLIKRVSKGYAERARWNPDGDEVNVDKGENLVFDLNFISLPMALRELPQDEDRYQSLDRTFRFLWAEERPTRVLVSFGRVAEAGPFTFRERLRESKVPVPLGQVPNLPHGR